MFGSFSSSEKEKDRKSKDAKDKHTGEAPAAAPAAAATLIQMFLRRLKAFDNAADLATAAALTITQWRSSHRARGDEPPASIEDVLKVLAFFPPPDGVRSDPLFTGSEVATACDEAVRTVYAERNAPRRSNLRDWQTVLAFFFLQLKFGAEKALPEAPPAPAAAITQLRQYVRFERDAKPLGDASKLEVSARCAAVLLLYLCIGKKGFPEETQTELEAVWFANCDDANARFTMLMAMQQYVPASGGFSSLSKHH